MTAPTIEKPTTAPTAGAEDVPAKPILNPSDPSKAADPKNPPGNPPGTEPTKNPEAPVIPPEPVKDGSTKDGAPAKAGAPETYTLKLPEGSTLDPSVLERTSAIARTMGLSNEHAQQMVETLHTEIASHSAKAAEAAIASIRPGGAEWTKQTDAWKAETLADPALGTTPAERTAAIEKGVALIRDLYQDSPTELKEFNEFLNTTGMGDHPKVARMFARLAKKIGEPGFVKGSPPGERPKTDVELFYGSSAEKKEADAS